MNIDRTLSINEISYLDDKIEEYSDHLGIFNTDDIWDEDHKVKTMTYKQYNYILYLIHDGKWFTAKKILDKFFKTNKE